MPEIDLTGIEALRKEAAPKARSSRLAYAVELARLDLFGDIDPMFGISAAQVTEQLAGISASEMLIRINSYGGDVYEGVAIHNLLASHPSRKIVEIVGCAASAASWVAMVADEIRIWENATMMIHQSWQGIMGNADALEGTAQTLRKIDDAMAAAYVRRSGLPDEDVRAMMAAETWMTAEEAVAKGFADQILKVGDLTDAIPAAAVQAERPASPVRVISPEVLAGLKGLADAMAPKGGNHA